MGSGKTTIGKLLASKLSFRFIDSDDEIEKFTNQSVNEIFSNQGEEFFRKTENKILKIIDSSENIVVATGGGTPCFAENLNIMNNGGTTIYLKCSTNTLLKRLSEEKKIRPLLKNKNSEELSNFIDSKLREREKFYNEAKLIIDTENFTTGHIVEIIYKLYAK